MTVVGGLCFVVGALAFVLVFAYLAVNFDYPAVLDGEPADVMLRLRDGGSTMRTIWAIYAFLPLLLVPGAVGAQVACPSSRGRMTLALVLAAMGSLAMCLGLMRWPSIHWTLAEAYARSAPDARSSLETIFGGLNLYLGTYVGEFLGETCLAAFFVLTGFSMLDERRFPAWLGWFGIAFGLTFLIGAFRNAVPALQAVADINNTLLPAWMLLLGGAFVWHAGRDKHGRAPGEAPPPLTHDPNQ